MNRNKTHGMWNHHALYSELKMVLFPINIFSYNANYN